MPQSQEVTLLQVMSDRLLIIADYQRPYAWGEKQLDDLWEDLDLLGYSGTHYAGTLVFRNLIGNDRVPVTEIDDEGTTLQRCEVVDGQQRLTTCLLLLDQCRRQLEALDARGVELAGGIARNLRTRFLTTTINKARRPKLSLGGELNEFWVDTVLGDRVHEGDPLIAGQRRLRDAKIYFGNRLENLVSEVDDDTRLARLRELTRRITAGLAFLVYEVQSEAEVGVIFETLNERGRPLTDLEKVKNYLLYLVRAVPDDRGAQLARRINSAWSEIFRNLALQSDGSEDQLLRAHWLATQNPDARLWKRVASIKELFQRSAYVSQGTRIVPSEVEDANPELAWSRLEQDVSGYVDTLRYCSVFLADTTDPDAAYENFASPHTRKRVQARTAALLRSGVIALYRPLLFAARLRYPEDGEFYADLVDLCERYSARVFVIGQWRSTAGGSRLSRLANDLYRGIDRYEILASVRADLWERAPDDRLRANLERTSEKWYWRRGHKYFLYEYELTLMAEGEDVIPWTRFSESAQEQRTTEHILPQKPADDALCWWSRFSREEHAALVHSLGNLVLTLDNSVYSNRCFIDKRDRPPDAQDHPRACYRNGKLHQERLLSTVAEWTPEAIAERQQVLADWALERWAVEPPKHIVLVEEVAIEDEGTSDDEVIAMTGG
jgi:hypothetical protein